MTTTLTPGSAAAGGAATDPVTTEIIRCSLNAAADEMNVTLIRSAYTPVIYEMKDCSVALLDSQHRVLGQSAGLPIFLGKLEEVTWLTEQIYGAKCWRPGDIWILNDAYLAGTHLHDMTVYGPVFVEERLVGFAASRAHWLDVGAKNAGSPTDSTDIFQEGLRLGATKVVEGGVERPDMVDLLCRNGRFPYPARGDLYAQIACVRNGQVRLAEIVERFGEQALADARDEIFDQTERLERAEVAALPDGTYAAEGAIDDDGVNGKPVWVRVKVIVAGEVIEPGSTIRTALGCFAGWPSRAISTSRPQATTLPTATLSCPECTGLIAAQTLDRRCPALPDQPTAPALLPRRVHLPFSTAEGRLHAGCSSTGCCGRRSTPIPLPLTELLGGSGR